ncbi:MAG: glycosyltransferase [Candidatus Marsarchaeota archaeon]|nr:glycosyltransferase [Candidatus Marsarchaeota archaeon]
MTFDGLEREKTSVMRILFVIPAYEPSWELGGIVQSQSLLCRALSAAGADVTVYSTDSAITKRLKVAVNQPVIVGGVRVFYFHTDWNLKYFYSRALAKACKRYLRQYDIVHIVSFWCYPGLAAAWEAQRQGVPYLMAPHGVFIPNCLNHGRLKKALYLRAFELRNLRRAAAIRYTSDSERQESTHLRLTNPSFVLANGLDFRRFDKLPPREEARTRLHLPHDARVVAYLGRLHPRKALDVLVSAFAELAVRIPDAFLVLAGPDDGHEPALRDLVRRIGLDQKVIFTGFLDADKRLDLLSATDLSTLVSHPGDNFGMAIAESMSVGIPALVSNYVGISSDIVTNGAGRSVPVEKDAIARNLAEMLSGSNALQETGQKARQFARGSFAVEVIAKKMLLAFDDVLSGRRSPGLGWSDAQ